MDQHKPCPNCGNELEFSAAHDSLHCRNCDTAHEVLRDPDFKPSGCDYLKTLGILDEQAEAAEQIRIDCGNCAAHLELPLNVVADRCCYCDSPVYAALKSARPVRPGAVLPFHIDRAAADRQFQKWLDSRWFLPGKVKSEARIRQFNGIYLPHWLYHNQTVTDYTGRRGEYYWVNVNYTVHENGKPVLRTRSERRTRWHSTAGRVHNYFHNLLVMAHHTLPDDLVKELTPWGLEALEEYRPDFIRGHQEQSYTLPLARGFERAKRLMEPEIRETIRLDIGGDEQSIRTTAVHYKNISYQLVLLPVWENHFEYRNKTFVFLVNARTGEVQGKRPWSVAKIVGFSLCLATLVGLMIALMIRYA